MWCCSKGLPSTGKTFCTARASTSIAVTSKTSQLRHSSRSCTSSLVLAMYDAPFIILIDTSRECCYLETANLQLNILTEKANSLARLSCQQAIIGCSIYKVTINKEFEGIILHLGAISVRSCSRCEGSLCQGITISVSGNVSRVQATDISFIALPAILR